MTDQTTNDNRVDLGYALATYIHKYPASCSLPWRIATLTDKSFSDPDMDTLVQEVEFWISVFEAKEMTS